MIIHIPAQEFRKAVYDILSTKQTTPVYASISSIPQDAPYPYITIGPFLHGASNGTKTEDINDLDLPIHVWSDDTSVTEIQEIMGDVATVLTSWPLEFDPPVYAVNGQNIKDWDIENDSTDSPWTCHGVIFFTAKIQYIGG